MPFACPAVDLALLRFDGGIDKYDRRIARSVYAVTMTLTYDVTGTFVYDDVTHRLKLVNVK